MAFAIAKVDVLGAKGFKRVVAKLPAVHVVRAGCVGEIAVMPSSVVPYEIVHVAVDAHVLYMLGSCKRIS